MENQQASEAGAGAGTGASVVDDPDQQVCADEAATLAATLEGGAASGSWYWTSMLNFSQSGSSSTHTSAGQLTGSQFAGSPASSSSVHINPNNANNTNNTSSNASNNNPQVDHTQVPMDSMLPSTNNSSDPEQAVWSQEFLSGPIGETKASMHACADDGLQELLYPRSVRELLLDQTPSWDVLQQAAITNKTFGFPLGSEDNLEPAQIHGLSPDIKPAHLQGLPYSHDDRLSSSTASSTLSDSTQQQQLSGAEHWPGPQSNPAQARTCPMHVPHTTLLQQQFDPARVKQEYAQTLSSPFHACSKPSLNPFLLHQQQHHPHPQHHSLRLLNSNQEQATLLNEAAMALNADVKPSKQLAPWPSSAAAAMGGQLGRPSSSFELAGLSSPAGGDHHQFLVNSLKQQHGHGHLDNAGFPATPNLISQEAAFFRPDHHHHHQLMQQAVMQVHHHAAGGALSTSAGLHQYPIGLKKTRAHMERFGSNQGGPVQHMEEGKDLKVPDQKAPLTPHDDYNFKRARVETPPAPQQQQQPPQTPASTSTSSFKSQPVRKEKIGERITTLQQLVSPFGKTDTASVLLEAIGYIKFLQEQVQTLSSPYLKSTNNPTSQNGEKNPNGEDAKPDLRSKGLCLVPLSCTMQVANDNGADCWYGGAFR